MGYRSYFNLIQPAPGSPEALVAIEAIKLETTFPWDDDCLVDILTTGCLCDTRWYRHATDMLRISGLCPTIRFEIDVDGEDNGDRWRSFAFDGNYSEYHQPEFQPEIPGWFVAKETAR
jgi:hypothetical protein